MGADQTDAELAAAWQQLAAAAANRPAEVMLALLEQLVEVACGTNPALKNYMRLRIYRGVLAKLELER
jgi:hypothetical protein